MCGILKRTGRLRSPLLAPLRLHFAEPLPQYCFFLLSRCEHIGRICGAVPPVQVLMMRSIFDRDSDDGWIRRNVLHDAASRPGILKPQNDGGAHSVRHD
jgi:hypothetical protein